MDTKEAITVDFFEGIVAAIHPETQEDKVASTRIILSMLVQLDAAHHSDDWQPDTFVSLLSEEARGTMAEYLNPDALEQARALGTGLKLGEEVHHILNGRENGNQND